VIFEDLPCAEPPTELLQFIHILRSALVIHIRFIDGIIAVLVGHDTETAMHEESTEVDQTVSQALVLMLQAVGSSSHTLAVLSKAPGLHTRDCYSIVRSIVEGAVNICYIIAEGPNAAEQALRHARQKCFRELDRQSRIGEALIQLAWTPKPDAKFIEGLKGDLAEFTSRRGREKSWTDLSIDDRIEIAGTKLGGNILTYLHFARFGIYRHASEILHGTLFGAMFFLGMTSPSGPPQSPHELAKTIGEVHMLVLFAGIQALSAIVEAFHHAYGWYKAYKHSRELWDEVARAAHLHLGKPHNLP